MHESDVYIGVLAHTKRLRLRKPWHLHRFLQGNFPKNTNFPNFLLPGRLKKKKEKTQKLKMLNYHGRYWLGSMLRRALQEINSIDTAKSFNSPKISWPIESPCLPEPFFHGEMDAVHSPKQTFPHFFFGFESVRRAVHSPNQNKKRLTV